MIADWIIDDNLREFLEVLGWISQYDFSPDEIDIIAFGVAQSDGDRDRWYGWEFGQ